MNHFTLTFAGAALLLHGLVELASLLSFRAPAGSQSAAVPKFIFQPLQDNLKVTMALGWVFGVLRWIAAAGIFFNLMWGWALGVLISVVTLVVMTFYLPMGIMDGILSGLTLVSLLVVYFGGKPILGG
jgi:hypothetical protein